MDPKPDIGLVSASRLAERLRLTPRAVRRRLAGIAPDQVRRGNGGETGFWRIESLPEALLGGLAEIARLGGYRDAHHLLADEDPALRPAVALAENPARQAEPIRGAVTDDGFPELRAVLSAAPNVRQLTKPERQRIWAVAPQSYRGLVQAGESRKTAKTRLCRLLWNSGANLAASRNALRMLFDRKYARWIMGGCKATALSDGRQADAQKRREPIPETDRQVIEAITVRECGGRLSQGWRKALASSDLSEDFAERFATNPKRKSHVPRIVRRTIAPGLPALIAQHHGERGARDNGAWVERDWSSVASYDWYNMDDATLPVYFHVPDGQGWWALLRGQFLLCIDLRSTCILGHALIPERSYNARAIRTLITHVSDEHGLPARGFYFERGIWEQARILKGTPRANAPLSALEMEGGLGALGLEVRHAIRARSKPVERVLGALQDLMEAERGYAGRDEMKAGFEGFKQLKLQVERKALDPREKFYDCDQWTKRLDEICRVYNSVAQEGKMTGAHSPAEALELFQDHSNPRIHFDARCRYLLATDRRQVRIGRNGITLRHGRQSFVYHDEQTGAREGERVLAWFNPEAPQVLAVTDLDMSNPFSVERAPSAPAMADSKEDKKKVSAAIALAESHNKYARTRYRTLKALHEVKFRGNLVSGEMVELGQQMEAQRGALKEKEKMQDRARRIYGRLNMPMPADVSPEQIKAVENMERLLARRNEHEPDEHA